MTRRRKRRRCCCHVVIVVVCSNTSVLFPPHGVRKYSVVGLCVFVWVCQQGFGDRGTHVVADMRGLVTFSLILIIIQQQYRRNDWMTSFWEIHIYTLS